jgi:hypothetical protein
VLEGGSITVVPPRAAPRATPRDIEAAPRAPLVSKRRSRATSAPDAELRRATARRAREAPIYSCGHYHIYQAHAMHDDY